MRSRWLVFFPLLLLGCSPEGAQVRKLQNFPTLFLPMGPAGLSALGEAARDGTLVSVSDLRPTPVYRDVSRKGQTYHARVIYTVRGAIPKGTLFQPMTRAQALAVAIEDPAAQAVVFDPDYTVSWVLPKAELPAVIAAFPNEKPLPLELHVRR